MHSKILANHNFGSRLEMRYIMEKKFRKKFSKNNPIYTFYLYIHSKRKRTRRCHLADEREDEAPATESGGARREKCEIACTDQAKEVSEKVQPGTDQALDVRRTRIIINTYLCDEST